MTDKRLEEFVKMSEEIDGKLAELFNESGLLASGVADLELADLGPMELADLGPMELADLGPMELADLGPMELADLGPMELLDFGDMDFECQELISRRGV